jgi:hypothetical protein
MRLIVIVFLLVSISPANADSWASAQPLAVLSDNAEWLVRVTPGESIGDVYGFAGAKRGQYAEALLLRYDEDLETYAEVTRYRTRNPVAPVDILVTNEGWLITLDNWHNFGFGIVVASYDNHGAVIQTLSLGNIFSTDQLDNLDRSVSSIWWRCAPAILDPIDKSIGVSDSLGRILSIDFLDGTVAVVGSSDNCVDDDT